MADPRLSTGPEWEAPPSAPKKAGLFSSQNLFRTTAPLATKETPAKTYTGSGKPTLSDRFNRLVPRERTYFGRSRRVFLFVIAGLFLLLVLILGLGLGLGLRHKGSASSLPLPSNTSTFTGDLTYYEPGLGACGIMSDSSEAICAVSHILFDAASTSSNPNENPLCGKMIRITRYDESVGANKSVDVKVVDRCVGCQAEDLDLSLSMFERLAEQSQGRVTGSWAWLN